MDRSLDTATCKSCGAEVSLTAKFCSECGANQPSSAPLLASQHVVLATENPTSGPTEVASGVVPKRIKIATALGLVGGGFVLVVALGYQMLMYHPNAAKAQYALAMQYQNGQGVPKNDQKALYWFRKAAEQGHADAEFQLGDKYFVGDTVAKDDFQALYWFRKAAEQGQADAEYNIGVMYNWGAAVTKDDAQAVIWWRKAAELGQADAKAKLNELSVHTTEAYSKPQARGSVWDSLTPEERNAMVGCSYGYTTNSFGSVECNEKPIPVKVVQ